MTIVITRSAQFMESYVEVEEFVKTTPIMSLQSVKSDPISWQEKFSKIQNWTKLR
jgi:hypothetical protein